MVQKTPLQDRALAYDAEQDRVRQDATTKAVATVAEKQATKREISAQRVLEETGNLAFARVTDVLKWEGQDGLVDSDKLPDHAAAAIESIEFGVTEDGQRYVKRIKFHAKMPAIDKLGQNQKLWGTKEEPSQQNNFYLAFLEAAKSGEIEREMQRRGLLLDTTTIEVKRVPVKGGEG